MDNAQQWALIVGFFSPMVVAIFTQKTWSTAARTCVMVVFSVGDGLGTAYFAGSFSGRDIVSCLLVAAVSMIAAYKGLFEPSGIAAAIERASSPKPNRAARRAGR